MNRNAQRICRQARDSAGWTQQELADRVRVDVRTIRNIEAGAHSPRWDIMVRIQRACELEAARKRKVA
jgi:DNA-binding XRE family transcriptional regulator